MYQSRNVIQAAKQANQELDIELKALRDGVKAEWMENWYDGLGYCKLCHLNPIEGHAN